MAEIDGDAPLMTWIIRHVARLLVRFQTWRGITPYKREMGREYEGQEEATIGAIRRTGTIHGVR